MASLIIVVEAREGDLRYELDVPGQDDVIAIPIAEDAAFSFELRGVDLSAGAHIELGDIPLPLFESAENSRKGFFSIKKRHLENYFGRCAIRVQIGAPGVWTNVGAFDVFAKKTNAIQAEAILTALSDSGEDILRYCFSKTSHGANHKNAEGSDPGLILLQAERIIAFIAKNRDYLRNHHRSRLISRERVSLRGENPPIDDASLSWLFQNFDQLVVCDTENFDLIIRGWKYNFSSINHVALIEDSNVYENQVLLSLLLSVKERLLSYLRDSTQVVIAEGAPLAGYVSLGEMLKRFLPVTGFWRSRCQRVIAESNTLIMFIQKNLPCEYVHDLRPNVTPFVRGNQAYRQIFALADRWYSLGTPDWHGQEYMVSLFSLPRLYEFFCLIEIIKAFERIGFILASKSFLSFDEYENAWGNAVERPSTLPANFYKFQRDGITVELFFEPRIWAFRNLMESYRIVDLSHASHGARPYRTPDFLIKIQRANQQFSYLYCDAKYSTPWSVREHHLPQLTEKYLLQTGQVRSDLQIISQRNCLGVFALHPNILDRPDDQRVVNPKNLLTKFGPTRHVVIPAIASIEVAPMRTNVFDQAMKNMLNVALDG